MTWGEEEDLVEAYRRTIRHIRDTVARHFHRVKGAGGAEYYSGWIHSQRYYSLRRKTRKLLDATHEETETLMKLRALLSSLKEFALDEMRPLGKAQWGCDISHKVICGPVWDGLYKRIHLALVR